jgi:hypothetical protein
MEPKTSIKQHDFISGEPKHKWVIHWTAEQTTNPCNEIQLQDWQETILRQSDGYQQGELGVTVAPAGVGKTSILQRMMETLGEERRVVNFDFERLYPEIQRYHHIVPEGHVSRPDDVNPNMRVRKKEKKEDVNRN